MNSNPEIKSNMDQQQRQMIKRRGKTPCWNGPACFFQSKGCCWFQHKDNVNLFNEEQHQNLIPNVNEYQSKKIQDQILQLQKDLQQQILVNQQQQQQIQLQNQQIQTLQKQLQNMDSKIQQQYKSQNPTSNLPAKQQQILDKKIQTLDKDLNKHKKSIKKYIKEEVQHLINVQCNQHSDIHSLLNNAETIDKRFESIHELIHQLLISRQTPMNTPTKKLRIMDKISTPTNDQLTKSITHKILITEAVQQYVHQLIPCEIPTTILHCIYRYINPIAMYDDLHQFETKQQQLQQQHYKAIQDKFTRFDAKLDMYLTLATDENSIGKSYDKYDEYDDDECVYDEELQ